MQKTLVTTIAKVAKVAKAAKVANLYNPHEQNKEQLIDCFVVRHDIFHELYREIKAAEMDRPGGHHLIEGQRGTGKTTLLLRLNYEIENDPALHSQFIPIVLKEEAYYGIRRLSALWKTIAQELEIRHQGFSGLHARMNEAYERAQQPIFHERNYEKACFHLLQDALNTHSNKLILFIDNFGELLYNFTGQELYRLYKILKECPSLQLIGASSMALEALISDDEGFFYALFGKKRLEGLDKQETYDLLRELAKGYGKEAVIERLIKRQPGRIESLRILTGGVIRTMVLLFEIFTEQEDGSTLADLDTVLDKVTPLYKHRMDILTPLQRDVVNAIALNWEAMSLEDIAKATHLHPEEIATILKDLEHVFIIEQIAPETRRPLYRLRERFFNIWYLMRLSIGNSQARVAWLLRFLESWYNKTELTQLAQKHTKAVSRGKCQPESAFYLTEAFVKTGVLDQALEHQLVLATKKLLQGTNTRLAAESSSSEQDLFKKGELYYQQEEYEKAIPLFLQLKEKNEHLYFRLGYAFSKVSRVTQAIPYFLQAAKLGHVEAMLHLGILYDRHLQDYPNAQKFYSMAAGKGHTDAMLQLGNLYYYTLQDYQKAKKYYFMVVKAAQERSKVLTSENFSLRYLKSYLVTAIKGNVKNPEKYHIQDFPGTQKDYLQAMKKTVSDALYQLGNLYTKHLRKFEQAEHYYRLAAETGHVQAMVALGDIYYYDQQDYHQAERYYLMAAKRKDVSALVNLGFLYHNTLNNYKKAEQCYLFAVQEGDVSAMNGLAWLYFQQTHEKQKSLHYARQTIEAAQNIHTAHTVACIYLWNDLEEDAFAVAEQFMYSREAYEILETDILFYLMLLLAKHHYHQALSYFESSDLDLRERFTPVYYALLYCLGAPDFDKLPPEIAEPVKDIIRQVKKMAVRYA